MNKLIDLYAHTIQLHNELIEKLTPANERNMTFELHLQGYHAIQALYLQFRTDGYALIDPAIIDKIFGTKEAESQMDAHNRYHIMERLVVRSINVTV